MNEHNPRDCPVMRPARAATLASLCLAASLLAGCKLAGPPPREYVLGTQPEPAAKSVVETGRPLLEVRRVQLPDYLDRTALLQRHGNELAPSETSRWGERLSVGMTRALADSLAARLPDMFVTDSQPLVGRPSKRLMIDVLEFEPRADQRVVLVAHWSIVDGASPQILTSQQTSLVEPIGGSGDEAIVSAMQRALEQLAGQVAASLQEPAGARPAGNVDPSADLPATVSHR
ncbi:MAG TPA: PqiC family protein [Steroidobacteraceae bacterium]|nr:PqiC family protein [Steroidobacteraceae bacterium]